MPEQGSIGESVFGKVFFFYDLALLGLAKSVTVPFVTSKGFQRKLGTKI